MKNNKGFSLVELIVVIAIMAILAAVAVVGFSVYIDQARNASDKQYIENLEYFTKLYATENQVFVEGLQLPKDKVDSVEDIKLWIIDPETNQSALKDYRDLPWIQDIYNGVGDWEFIGDLEYNFNGDEGGEEGGDGDNDEVVEDPDCQHNINPHVEVTKKQPTCYSTGLKVLYCADCNAKIDEQELDLIEHDYEPLNVGIQGFTISQCTMCYDKLIKNENNLPLVPVG